MRWYRAVALDLDGTLSDGGWPAPEAMGRIDALRTDGVRVLLVTGRILAELDVEFPGLADHFDAVVGENGAVLRVGDWTRRLAEPLDPALLDRLHAAGVSVRRGEVLLAGPASADHIALDAIGALGLDVHLIRNRAALMLLPPGVTKGTGLLAALDELDVSPLNTLAVGDAENDHALLSAAGLGVAVGNAVGSLRDRADLVLALPDGAGVADLLGGPILSGERCAHSRRRWIVLGADADGRPAALPADQTNLLITGDSGSGKSYLAGLVIEQLVALGYSVLVVDPEGDHVPLGALRGVTILGAPGLADPRGLPARFGQGTRCLVLDLSGLDAAARADYVDRMWPPMLAYREQTTQPHWLVLEEAQSLSSCRGPLADGMPRWGLCLVTYKPDQIGAGLLARMDWRVALPQAGSRAGIVTPPGAEPYPFTFGRRSTRHVRHWHKYVDSPLPDHERFLFHDGDGRPGVVAASLREFVAAVRTVPDPVIAFHAGNGDFSRWLAEVYRDPVLASLVATTEHDLAAHGSPGRVRRLLLDLVTQRYLPAETP